jgi:hypothetical protein
MNRTIQGSLPIDTDTARHQRAYDSLDALVARLIDQEFEGELRRVRRALLDA